MIFSPVLRRNAFNPQAADLALQRFLQGTLGNAAPSPSSVQVQRDEKATTLQLDVPGWSGEQRRRGIEGAVARLASVEGAPPQGQRAGELDHEIDTAASSAKLENGVLTLSLARLEPQSKARDSVSTPFS